MKPNRLPAALMATVLLTAFTCTELRSQVLYYNFNETGTTGINSGTGGTTYNFSLLDSTGTAANLHGTNIYGSSGSSLNLTSASGMGSGASAGNPVAYSSTAGSVLNGVTTFTVAGWYLASSSPSASARIFQTGNLILFCGGSYLTLQYGGSDQVSSNSVAGGIITNASGDTLNYNVTADAVFFAVTYSYDSVAGTKTITFYQGDSSDSSSLSSYTITYTPTATTYTNFSSIYVGGNASGASNTRPFDGWIDDFAIYTSVLDETNLNNLRVNQILGIPEPSTTLIAMIGIFIFVLSAYIQKKKSSTVSL